MGLACTARRRDMLPSRDLAQFHPLTTRQHTVFLLVGLILLALLLLTSGIALLVGLENIQSRLFGVAPAQDATSPEVKASAPSALERVREGDSLGDSIEMQDLSKRGTPVAGSAPTSASSPALRPFRAAKARLPSHDDKLYGLLLVIGGLSLLWIIPAYLLSSSPAPAYPFQPPAPHPQYGYGYGNEGPYSEKQRRSASKAGQGVLGIVTLLVLIISFALLKPDKSTDAPHAGETEEARQLRKKEKWVLR